MNKTIYKTILATCSLLLCGCTAQPKQSAVFENTAIPEPQKETIELNIDNWQDYIETREEDEVEYKYNAFGEAEYLGKYLVFYFKDGYTITDDCIFNIDVEISFISDLFKLIPDFENKTLSIGEHIDDSLIPEEEKTRSDIYTFNEVSTSSNPETLNRTVLGNLSLYGFFKDDTENTLGALIPVNTQITRIQGTMEVLKQA